ncbi:MAG: hypothetical protein A2589_03590 [Candidatus Vogelbacteria bacterium RIFOXYD1_FULL_46_19]|uniref:ParB-like N-terminal domain-containing protein n=1 Tax=Candidatus Vogelbacteria bacterium RIFOXYD1_FULL_46_19 TaxID=1802439 RepID=A0A1G2QFC2_9BACT|nr:MAG: hypothetical protein A2589_03590 [Candidatus Vogelbacteria bacterium RIFOXYD1_FULL_46_19]
MDEEKHLYNHSIFWIDLEKIKPNPYQPRREFDEDRLRDLADSIRQYGVLQPLVVTRREIEREDGSLYTEYELIAGERRLRASKIAGLYQVPAIIRAGNQTDKMKLEMAIIENLQREDLNPIDRAEAFMKLIKEFNLKHTEVAKKVGRSREYVSNSVRILGLPQEMLDALVAGKITEGHTRPLLMLIDRPAEQMTLFKDITARRLTVREAEAAARRVAIERVRKIDAFINPELYAVEERLSQKFGTKVKVEKKDQGGRLTIAFFSPEDLNKILSLIEQPSTLNSAEVLADDLVGAEDLPAPIDDSTADDELYSIRNFSL